MKHFKTTGVVSATKDRMFLLPFCIFFRKHSCLNAPITERIDRYTSSGLLHYWTSQYFQKRFVKVKTDRSDSLQPQHLNLKQLYGVFIISCFLLFFAILVFLVELLSTKFEFLQKIFIRLSW